MFKRLLKSRIFISIVFIFLVGATIWFWPSKIKDYDNGVTFSSKYAIELGLDPKDVFDAMTDELGIKKVRLVAYWDEIEGVQDSYDFSDLDWQMEKAQEKNLDVIFTLGRRVPRWPECHTPDWVYKITEQQMQEEFLVYMKEVVNRYKEYDVIKIWQVENEPFLTVYVPEKCGTDVDKDFFEREIELVRSLDEKNRPILTTDSGNLGLWSNSYKRGDLFGSTFYVYLANETVGGFKTIVNHNFYNAKRVLMTMLHGKKPVYLIETSMEPWLTKPIPEVPIEEQLVYMNIERLSETIESASKVRFDEQYLWGVEWWYYLRENGHPEIWDFLKKELFSGEISSDDELKLD